MIFNSNTTALGASTIPMAEGYDCSYGSALALVESARNDYAMFEAFVKADYREMSLNESAEVESLHEAVGGGIIEKIKELLKKLIAKIKSIFNTFMAKINGLYMKDKELVKKYRRTVMTKQNIGKMEVKWRKYTGNGLTVVVNTVEEYETAIKKSVTGVSNDNFDTYEKRVEHFTNNIHASLKSDSISEFKKELEEFLLEDEDTYELSEVGGIASIISFLDGYSKRLSDTKSNSRKITSNLEKLVKKYDRELSDTIKTKAKDDAAVSASKLLYDLTVAYQDVTLASMDVVIKLESVIYKQNKAAFMKAVTISEKKLEHTDLLAEAVYETAAQEVEDVISGALSKEELSELCAASKNVLDADAKDCPNTLTYTPDKYAQDASFKNTQGSIDSRYDSKKESAFFGELLY